MDKVIVADVIGMPVTVQQREGLDGPDVVQHFHQTCPDDRTSTAVHQIQALALPIYERVGNISVEIPDDHPQVFRQLHDIAIHWIHLPKLLLGTRLARPVSRASWRYRLISRALPGSRAPCARVSAVYAS